MEAWVVHICASEHSSPLLHLLLVVVFGNPAVQDCPKTCQQALHWSVCCVLSTLPSHCQCPSTV